MERIAAAAIPTMGRAATSPLTGQLPPPHPLLPLQQLRRVQLVICWLSFSIRSYPRNVVVCGSARTLARRLVRLEASVWGATDIQSRYHAHANKAGPTHPGILKKARISLMKARTCIIQVPSESVKKRQNYLHHRAHYEFRPKISVLHRQRMRKTSFPIR